MNPYPAERQADVDIAWINARTRLAIALAMGGMLALVVGLIVLLFGSMNTDTADIRIAGAQVSASGIGAVIMATSVLWAWIAWQAKPSYRASHRATERTLPDGSRETEYSFDSTQSVPDEIVEQVRAGQRPPDGP